MLSTPHASIIMIRFLDVIFVNCGAQSIYVSTILNSMLENDDIDSMFQELSDETAAVAGVSYCKSLQHSPSLQHDITSMP